MLTVAFATRNRAAFLGRVLDAFAALHAPAGGWKLIAVDNGSTDDTQDVLSGFATKLPLTCVREPRSGKNRALNAALPAFEGDLAVFTDDDVLPAPDWLIRLREAADAHAEATIFGGSVQPEWPGPVPEWLTEDAVSFSVLYAKLERPSGPCDYHAIFGPNMAVRSSVFQQGVCFAENVGPDAAKPLYAMGSETDLIRRLQELGHTGWFVSEASVRHILRPEQLTEDWILARCYRYGLSRAAGLPQPERGVLGQLGSRNALRIAAYHAAAVLARGMAPSSSRLRILARNQELRGLLAGARLRSRLRRMAPSSLSSEEPSGVSAGSPVS
jgi:glycosyltransferase involved in cell wall biosynthesis